MNNPAVWTIGHSTHAYADFLNLLRNADINAIADVRTAPVSQHVPQFNQAELQDALRRDGIAYVFLGRELGGRPRHKSQFFEGVADYEKMATSDEFAKGLARVVLGAQKYRIALMCSEHDPLDCHRCLLVARALARQGTKVEHILANGVRTTQSEIEERLLAMSSRAKEDLFLPREERLNAAYRERARKVAYAEPQRRGSIAAE